MFERRLWCRSSLINAALHIFLNQKSSGVRSGERAGQRMAPPRPSPTLHCIGKLVVEPSAHFAWPVRRCLILHEFGLVRTQGFSSARREKVFEHSQISIASHVSVEKVRTHDAANPNAAPNVDTWLVKRLCGEEIRTVLGSIGAVVPINFSGKMKMRSIAKTDPVDPDVILVHKLDLRTKVQTISFIFSGDFMQEAEFPTAQLKVFAPNVPNARFRKIQVKRCICKRGSWQLLKRSRTQAMFSSDLADHGRPLRAESLVSPNSVNF